MSNLADGVLKVGLPLVAVGQTRSPVLIAGLTFAFTVPWLLFALPAGALADRCDRRRRARRPLRPPPADARREPRPGRAARGARARDAVVGHLDLAALRGRVRRGNS
ncbi:MFS transporter [Amycolatopsis bartoniae]|nr:MFS transporter [Amycolatopsis bartoniae]